MLFWRWQATQTAALAPPASASPTATAPRGHASSNVPSARASSAQPLGFMRLRVGWAYLIQLWGDALWQWHLANPDARLTTAATAPVRGPVTARAANYYEVGTKSWRLAACCRQQQQSRRSSKAR